MTNTQPCQIFMIEERSSLARCYSEFLSKENLEINILPSSAEAMDYFAKTHTPTLILLDLQLQDIDGLELLSFIIKQSPQSAIVVITSNGSFEISRQVMQMGAVDYLEKPFTRDRLCITMRNARKQLELEKATNSFGNQFCGFIGSSISMQAIYRIIQSAASSSKASVFITGESGTGKEVCSQAIHELSERTQNNCVILNCAAIPKELIESEIFGRIKGSFTGAMSHHEGAATRAHRGTLFLDEIGEMDLELQSKLLRFVQTGKFTKVGSSVEESVDVRFICATNRDPLLEIQHNRFREDLYYRLNVIPINMPPLRDRGFDILTIAEHYLKIFAKEENKSFTQLANETRNIFLKYQWPGNVRQLLNVLRNIVVLHEGHIVEPKMLPEPLNKLVHSANSASHCNVTPLQKHANMFLAPAFESSHAAFKKAENDELNQYYVSDEQNKNDVSTEDNTSPESISPLWKVEMEAIDRAVKLCNGNITQAAKYLEINPSTIHCKKQAWLKNGQPR